MKFVAEHVKAAKLIRAELKKAFPATKFSVRSESYSMGNSVNVSWDHGPDKQSIRDLLSKYEAGSFDGRTDTYEFSNLNKELPKTKFVMLYRY